MSSTRSFDLNLLKILRCPETRQELKPAPQAVLEKLNKLIVAGSVKNRAGQNVNDALTGGLLRADERMIYPVFDNIPILLVDEAIPLAF